MNGHLQTIKFAIIFVCLIEITITQLSCASNCTASTPNAYCTSQGYCACNTGFIFNCNTTAINLLPGINSITSLYFGQTYFFILKSYIGQQLVYSTTFEDKNNATIISAYNPNFFTDIGMASPPYLTTYTNLQYQQDKNKLTCSFRISLSNQVGTDVSSKLILKITISTPSPSLVFTYSYGQNKDKNQSIFLIIGYIVGGLLLLTSMIFIVLIYRKKRHHPPRQNTQQVSKLDISHFTFTMPPTLISPDQLKETNSCSVCLQQFDFNSHVRITVCKHIFHVGCIDEWCSKKVSCPMCRTQLTLQNITQLKAQQQKSSLQNEWIMNSLHQQQEPNQIRNPLFDSQQINNSQL